ncbi:unnamed protein product, partial [Aureobasidium uvarum]
NWCLIFFVLFGQLSLLGYAQTCYWPDKSIAETLTSCNSVAKNSHCCGADSLCLDNGGLFCCGMGWNDTSGLCLAESASGNLHPFAIEVGVAILDRTTGATVVNTTTSGTANSTAT